MQALESCPQGGTGHTQALAYTYSAGHYQVKYVYMKNLVGNVKAAIVRFVRFLVKWTIITGGVVSLAALIGAMFFSHSTVTYAEKEVQISNMPEKISALKLEVVNAISNCEVPGYKDGAAPIILDTNNKMSIGPMMFQVATVIHYEKQLYGKDVTALEATNIALDEGQAKALAQDIMFKDSKGVGNWFNCMNKTGVSAKIGVIKELEK